MSKARNGFTLIEVVIALLVISLISVVALSGVMLSTRRTSESLQELKVSNDLESVAELAKSRDFDAAMQRFTNGKCVVTRDGENAQYLFYVNEDLPETERFFSELPVGEAGDRLYEVKVQRTFSGTTMDQFGVWMLTIQADAYAFEDGAYQPVRTGLEDGEPYYDLNTTIVAPMNDGEDGA